MTDLILLLTLYSIVTTIGLIKYYKKNEINYSNYQNCLRALSEYDKDLAEYLEKDGVKVLRYEI